MGQGGAEKIVYQLCIDNDAHEQFVISAGGAYVIHLKEHGIKHYIMPDIDQKKPVIMLRCFCSILYVVIAERIDIIHSHHRMAAFYANLISMITGVKCVYTAHNVYNCKIKLTQFALKKSSIVAVGDGVKSNLESIYKIPTERITVIYNSIKIDASGKKDQILCEFKNNKKLLVGTIGRLCEQKGIDVFISALGKVIRNNSDVIGVIIGDGEDRDKIKLQIKELGLSDHVIMLGYRSDVLDIIRQLDFVVLASRWEGLPLTPIEVFSQGKTIIVTDISGNNEIVQDDVNGLLFKKDDVDELIDKINELLQNKDKRARLEQRAFETYQMKYRHVKFVEQYNTIYANI